MNDGPHVVRRNNNPQDDDADNEDNEDDVVEEEVDPAMLCREQSSSDEGENGEDDADCAICYGPYKKGEEIRRLRCNHTFHSFCIDTWLLNHQNKCPLCGFVVGPQISEKELKYLLEQSGADVPNAPR